MRNRNTPTSALFALAFALVAACAASTIATQVRMPPRSAEAATLHRIAVMPFSGRDGRAFAEVARAQLQSAALDGTLYFTVVSNEALLAAGLRGSASDTIARLVSAGRAAGVDAVYSGSADGANVSQTSRQERRTRCVEYEGLFNCKREEEYVATCYTTVAVYSATPQVVNVRTGSVAYTEQLSARSEYEYCNDRQATRTNEDLIAEARQTVATLLRQRVAPYNATVSVAYKSSAPDITDAAQRQQFDGAVAFARAGQVDRACAMWLELAPGDQTNSVALLYNLGVCAEVVSDYARAVSLYSRAESMLQTPDRQVFEARQRAQSRLTNEHALRALPRQN